MGDIMVSEDVQNKILTIQKMKDKNVFKNYIEYIQFPFFKNLMPGTRINFTFPITILVGKNGSGKSSTLHALYGAPNKYTCADFWFSTEVDPILESGDRNRFFYGYRENGNDEIKEVLKTRMKRGSKTKEEDPDYWETSRPVQKDGMVSSKDRYKPVIKNVVYLDFRREISAFDKVFYFSKESLEEKKKLLRDRSKYLSRLFNDEPMRFRGCDDNKIGQVETLNERSTEIISNILGKEYVSIKVAKHKIFKNPGISIYVKTKNVKTYSEANAGSGETAVIQLVKNIEDAPDFSLILLDEPEVSIHPAAQDKLKNYLLDVTKEKKLQIVISTHSPALIHEMPISALKLFKTEPISGKFIVQEEVNYQEAFFDIEERVYDKKIIYCEDTTAREILIKVLKCIEKEQFFDVMAYPGGAENILKTILPVTISNMQLLNKVFIFLDGDMDRQYKFDRSKLTVEQANDPAYLLSNVEKAYGIKIPVNEDGGNGGRRVDQECEAYLKYLEFYNNNMYYLPNHKIPEEIILSSQFVKTTYDSVLAKYDTINSKNAKEILRKISKIDYGDEEHYTATISFLANKWVKEESEDRSILIDIFLGMF